MVPTSSPQTEKRWINKAKYIKAIEEKKQPKSNITSKFKRGKKGQTEKATNKTNPATQHERIHMPDMSPEIQDTRSKAAYHQNAHQHLQQSITTH